MLHKFAYSLVASAFVSSSLPAEALPEFCINNPEVNCLIETFVCANGRLPNESMDQCAARLVSRLGKSKHAFKAAGRTSSVAAKEQIPIRKFSGNAELSIRYLTSSCTDAISGPAYHACSDSITNIKVTLLGKKVLVEDEGDPESSGQGEVYEIGQTIDLVKDRRRKGYGADVDAEGYTYQYAIHKAQKQGDRIIVENRISYDTDKGWAVEPHPQFRHIEREKGFSIVILGAYCQYKPISLDSRTSWVAEDTTNAFVVKSTFSPASCAIVPL